MSQHTELNTQLFLTGRLTFGWSLHGSGSWFLPNVVGGLSISQIPSRLEVVHICLSWDGGPYLVDALFLVSC